MNKPNKKLLLIGWDAADWKIINPFLDAGLMPNLHQLINGGVIGNLATLDPPYSPMLWTSIATGKRPYKHGVLGFTELNEEGTKVRPVLSSSRKVAAIWDMLSHQQLKTHVVGWWPSHPAEQMNGICISNLYQKTTGSIFDPWPLAPDTISPKAVADEYAQFRVHPEELTYEHILPFVPTLSKIDQRKDRRVQAVAKVTAHAASLHAAFTNILRTKDWNFAAVYLDAIDHYCHGFMKYFPPKRPHIGQAEYDRYKDVIAGGYRFHDMMLGRLIELAGEEAVIMLVSDHGFQPDHLRPTSIPKEPAGPAYEHSPYGIFCMKGPNIKKDEIIYGASLLDITPTILSVFQLPIGEDMDGKVLINAFEKEILPRSIPSWEDYLPTKKDSAPEMAANSKAEEVMFQQLEELGYINNRNQSAAAQLKSTKDECTFNLAKSYLDGGKIKEGTTILEELHAANPFTPRYAFRLAVCYQMVGQLKKCRLIIEQLKEQEHFNHPVMKILEASLLIGEKQPLKALKLYKETEKKIQPEQSKLFYQIATCYTLLQRWSDAERALLKELELDYDHADAHQLLGSVYLKTNRFEDAVNSLLIAIGLNYNMPHAHILLGRACYKLGEYGSAAESLEVGLQMMPQLNAARELLVEIYKTHLGLPEKANLQERKYSAAIKGTITIVSGLPRSGTSMMMQMLVAGGLEAFTDGQRISDENNPKGYYEHEAVKSLATNKNWIPEVNQKVVKIVAHLLHHLPSNYQYKIVFMERNVHEVLASQHKMLNRLGKKTKDAVLPLSLMNAFQKTLTTTKQWASRQPNVDILYVPYGEVLKNPFFQALRINEFLDYQLLPELMVQMVDQKLYREQVKG